MYTQLIMHNIYIFIYIGTFAAMAVVEENAKHPIRISMVIDDIAARLDSTRTHARTHPPRVERLTTFVPIKKKNGYILYNIYIYIYIYATMRSLPIYIMDAACCRNVQQAEVCGI